MKKEEFNRIAAEINSRPLTDFYDLTPSKGGLYCCPICGSGTGPHKTGALKLYRSSNRVRCFANECFTEKGEDTLGALQRIWELQSPVEVMQRLGYTIEAQKTNDGASQKRKPAAPTTAKPKPAPPLPEKDYTDKYKEWHDLLLQAPEALKYLKDRGINREAIEALNLGYSPSLGYGERQSNRAPRIVFPYDAHFYKARRIDGKDDEAKYIVSGGGTHIYNTAAFSDKDTDGNDRRLFPVVVVEGEFDAAAIIQGGYNRVIALGSTGHRTEFVKQAKQENPAAVYILALDNDPENPDPKKDRHGQKAQAELEKQMEAAGLKYISADTAALYGEYTDAAEAILNPTQEGKFWDCLMKEYVDLGYNLREDQEQEEQIEAYYRSGPGMVDTFLYKVQGEMYKPLPTGIQTIDRAIGGGLFRQTVVVLGAAPGMGKTSLAAQIGESIANAGTADVLYINLEMSREQLLARSLARIAYRNGRHSISTTEILQGYRWTADTEEAVTEAADEYKATIAQHLIYNPGEDTTDLDAIMEKIQDEKKRLGHAPLVILDYLQLVTGQSNGRDEDNVATIKRTMQRLKEYAIRENTTAIIITANNRSSMATGESGINSGRDTSNIEYGADLHLGIEYTAVTNGEKKIEDIRRMKREHRKNPQDPAAAAEYEMYCTGYSLKVNKNRNGEDEREAQLKFNGACAMFIPLDSTHTDPPRGRTI